MKHCIAFICIFSFALWSEPDSDGLQEIVLTTNPCDDFDTSLCELQNYANSYIKQLNGDLGCWIMQYTHAILNTERKAWLEKRKFEVNELLSVTSSKYLTRTQKLILLDPYLEKMNDEWLAIKKAPPQGGLVNQFCVSQRDAPVGLEHTVDEAAYDKFADYFHNKTQNCMAKLRALTEQNQDSFQKLRCSTCKKRPAKIMHNNAPTCRHLVSCQACSKGLRACPVCNIENKNLVMLHNAKCFGCSLETVDTYCAHCLAMKYCSSCASEVKNKKGKKKYKCSRLCRFLSGDLVQIRMDDSQ